MISLFCNYLKSSSFLFNTNLHFRKLNIIKKTTDINMDFSTKCKMATEGKKTQYGGSVFGIVNIFIRVDRRCQVGCQGHKEN